MTQKFLNKELELLKQWRGPRLSGRVTHVIGLLIESNGPTSFIGEICYVYDRLSHPIPCQVVGFKERKVLLMPLADVAHISPGAEVFSTGEEHRVPVGEMLRGRILDGLGRPIDGKGDLFTEKTYPVFAAPPPPLSRTRISNLLETKIKAIDALCTLGKGQRVGIFSPPGVGKSMLMGMIARYAESDINVIALIGERGREVGEFVERELGAEGLARSVVVVATSDQAALLRAKGANVATSIAEFFRDQGKHVILMMDSISRYALALREVGLAIGEPPTTRGYTPSVFAHLPRLLERAGTNAVGSITGIYTVLNEDKEVSDPIAEHMTSLLDGHIYLAKNLTEICHFPPINILKSLSRVMPHITSAEQQVRVGKFRSLLHTYEEAEELIRLGAYRAGTDSKIDESLEKIENIRLFLRQDALQPVSLQETLTQFKKVV
jgi:flagellum-specific ATP synthase